MMTDPIADMLTRIRNGLKARFDMVEIPASNIKTNIAKILKDEGYISNFKVTKDAKQGILQVFLKYGSKGERTITEIQRISKPSIRVYVGKGEVPRVRNNLGLAILSTSKGVISDKQARKQGVGGEVICSVW
ncbi:MAG: 30S ribosomal protein S8 [Deltaproteobacteria bacterium]|nr:30S ribosomal protein S8 [Deltaproteobacteria bacterium]